MWGAGHTVPTLSLAAGEEPARISVLFPVMITIYTLLNTEHKKRRGSFVPRLLLGR